MTNVTGAPIDVTPEEIEQFEAWAKTVYCNLDRCPYPQNYSTYRNARTQHLFEGVVTGLRLAKRAGGPSRVLFQEERAALRGTISGDAPLPPVCCDKAPEGWLCLREIDHSGPCAAHRHLIQGGAVQ